MTKRRRRRDASSKKAGSTHLVVSFVPLLRGEAGTTIAIERARETLGPMLETDAGHVDAVVWAGDDDGSPCPILVLDRADEVFEHLVEWAEGSPAAWFTLACATRGGNYTLALMPRVDRSVERYRMARRLISGEEVPADASFRIVFRPLLFRGPMSAVSREMLARLPARVRVGFLPRGELPGDPSDLDFSTVRLCGPIDVEKDRTGYLRRLLRQANPRSRRV